MATVDVVIPAHDAEATLDRTLDAVCAQVGVDLTVTVVDDGSSDGTQDIATRRADGRIRVVRQDNAGPAAARNTGAAIGSAPWIAFLDADQVPDPAWLRTLLERGGHGRVVGSGGRFVAPDGSERLHRPPATPDLAGTRVIYQPGHFIVRRDLFDAAGGYDDLLRYSENTELGFRLERHVAERSEITVVDEVLVTTHDPASGRSRQFTRRRRLESAERIIEVHGDSLAPRHIALYHAIAGVQARHLGARATARAHLLAAVRRRPGRWRYWLNLVRSVGPDRPAGADGPRRTLVLHVMPVDLPRGGQAETRTICDRLGRPDEPHRALTLFRSAEGNLQPEHRLDVPDGRLRRFGFDPRAAIRLRGFVHRTRPAIVIAHGSEPLKYAAFLGRSTPIVYHKIGVVSDAGNRPLRSWLHRRLIRRPDLVVAVSSDAAEDAADFGRGDAIVVPNCRAVDAYPASDPPRHDGLRAVFVGQLTASKQPEVFVEAIDRLRRDGVEVTGSMAGDGPLRPRLEALAPPEVTVLGPRADIAALLGDHDVTVFTSRREGEGMPGVLIEAGLCARPVVAFDGPGVRDIVIDGCTGRVVAAGDIGSLTSAISDLASDPELRRAMGAAARRHCESAFDVAVVVDMWRDALGRVG